MVLTSVPPTCPVWAGDLLPHMQRDTAECIGSLMLRYTTRLQPDQPQGCCVGGAVVGCMSCSYYWLSEQTSRCISDRISRCSSVGQVLLPSPYRTCPCRVGEGQDGVSHWATAGWAIGQQIQSLLYGPQNQSANFGDYLCFPPNHVGLIHPIHELPPPPPHPLMPSGHYESVNCSTRMERN